MDQTNKNNTGAPSDDTTSALFVSARKKQLEQQEADRRAKEKEAQRLAAEAEVKRLEAEVEERRRKAEEDAKLVAEEARAKKAQAASNPDAILGSQAEKKDSKMPNIPKLSVPKMAKGTASGGGSTAAGLPLSPKMLAIIGGGIAVVIVVVILIITLSGGRPEGYPLENHFSPLSMDMDFSYPNGWTVTEDANNKGVTLKSDLGTLFISDATETINNYMADGLDVMTAVEQFMQSILSGINMNPEDMPTPSLSKTGDYVSGSVEYVSDDGYTITVSAEVIENHMMIFITKVHEDNSEEFYEAADAILFSLMIGGNGGGNNGGGNNGGGNGDNGEYGEYIDGLGYSTISGGGTYNNGYITVDCPAGWYILEFDNSGMSNLDGAVLFSPEQFDGSKVGAMPIIIAADYTRGSEALTDIQEYWQYVAHFTNEVLDGSGITPLLGNCLDEVRNDPRYDDESTGQVNVYKFDTTQFSSQLDFIDATGRVYGALLFAPTDGYVDECNSIIWSIKPI